MPLRHGFDARRLEPFRLVRYVSDRDELAKQKPVVVTRRAFLYAKVWQSFVSALHADKHVIPRRHRLAE